MANIGFHDGLLKAKAVQVEQKKLASELYLNVYSSATALKAAFTAVSTAAVKLGTAIDCPRTIRFVNALVANSGRAVKLSVVGYDAQGDSVEEIVTLSTGSVGVTRTNNAFSYVTSITPLVATKGFGTYSTVGVYPCDKFGLREYCEQESDVISLQTIATVSAGTRTSTSYPINSTTFSPVYQTLNATAFAPAGKHMRITYLSKGQKRFR